MPERRRLLDLLEQHFEFGSADRDAVLDLIEKSDPVDVARCFEEFDAEPVASLLEAMPSEQAGAILVAFGDRTQRDLVAGLPIEALKPLVATLQPDDAADIYNKIPRPKRQGVLASLPTELANQIRKLAEYDEETAGGIMTPTFVAVRADETVGEVLSEFRNIDELETDQLYVTDEAGHLRGVFSMQALVREADPKRRIADLMEAQVLSVHEDDDQEEVVRLASTYGLSTVPVVDDDSQLVGIITADDLDYVQAEEASEDIFRMAGTVARHPTKLPVSRRILLRLPAILVTVLVGLLNAQILSHMLPSTPQGHFVGAMRYVLIVIALAGNVATIANSIVVRGLATGELERGRLLDPFLGELLVGIGIGIVCAGLTFAGIAATEPAWRQLAPAVALALTVSVSFSAMAGFSIPVVSDRLGLDPALAGPLVTAFNDLSGTIVYVAICAVLTTQT